MGKGNFPLYAFNRGEVSRLALGRVDLDRMRLSAEEQVNFQPMVLGPMMLRPGLQFLGRTRNGATQKAVFVPFVFGNTDTAALELTGDTGTSGAMRVWLPSGPDGELALLTRPAVATVVPQGNFDSAAGWTLSPPLGGADTAKIAGGKLTLNAVARGATGSCSGRVLIPVNSRGKEHALRITIDRGPVTFRAGTASGSDNVIATTRLAEGEHSLAFTPAGNSAVLHVGFETADVVDRIVDRIVIEGAGVVTLPTPWAAAHLPLLRYTQSGDVVYVACRGVPPYLVERRAAGSWSVVKYLPQNGPLQAAPAIETKMRVAAMHGNTTLHSQRPFFKQQHVGCLFRLFTPGQTRQAVLAGDDAFTDPVRITGVGGNARHFRIAVTGTFNGILTLERSFEDGDLGVGFSDTSITIRNLGNTSLNETRRVEDGHDNLVVFYRVGFRDGDYTSGSATVSFLDSNGKMLSSGGDEGICRVTGFINDRQVSIEVLQPFTATAWTDNWQEGEWSQARGYPSAVAFHDGRLWWAGGDKIWGSVPDDYSNFDMDMEGDAAPISRSVGFGPVDTINWLLPLTRLVLGREGAETSVRSSSLDEPITPSTFTLKDCSTKGSAHVAAVRSDTRGVFVSKSGRKAYELSLDLQAGDYAAHDLTRLHPAIAGAGFVRLCIQHSPDTAIHFVRDDGQAAVLLYDKEDEVEAWWRIETDGAIEDSFVLPGTAEDHVYYVVRRTTSDGTERYLEKFSRRDQCRGRPEARLSDSHVVDVLGDRRIQGLGHLKGKQVVAWGWNDGVAAGVDLGTYTVTPAGEITLPVAYHNVCVGLGYSSSFISTKLAYAAEQGSALNQRKRVERLGLVLYDTHAQGLQLGQRGDVLDALPLVSAGETLAADTVHAEFDEAMIEMPGEWSTDARLHLKAAAPRPCTVAAALIGLSTHA